MKALDKARLKAREAIESLYEGLCTVQEYMEVTGPQSKLTRHEEATVLEDQPCRLSFEGSPEAAQTETTTNISQSIKLFIAPEVRIKSGSKIVVTQHGVTTAYAASGAPAVYVTHQEIMLELFRGWA